MTTLEQPMSIDGNIVSALAGRLSGEAVIHRDEPLSRRTTLRVGGPADVYVEPASEADLSAVLKFCASSRLAVFVLGRGSNLLIRDGGIRGVVLSLSHGRFSGISAEGERLVCGAGARLKQIAVEARRLGLAGFEFMEGIPGSLGGALRMNAGAMGTATFDVVERVRLMDYSGELLELTPAGMDVRYRGCERMKTHIGLGAVLHGHPDSFESVAQRMSAFSRKRWSSQPAAASAGCVFKNPADIAAGKLIDELGLKGTRVGGARVSLEHGNFIVNDGSATAADVLGLIDLLRQRALADRGIRLQTEVEIVGEDLK